MTKDVSKTLYAVHSSLLFWKCLLSYEVLNQMLSVAGSCLRGGGGGVDKTYNGASTL